MFEIDGKIFRNIQEQVQKNKSDIAAIRNVETVLNEFGVRVLSRVDTEADIPEGTYEYGDAYLVGTEPPYDMYIYTRDDADGEFINIGPIAMVGPQGAPGEKGETGATGATGATGPTGNGIYTITKTATDGLVDTYTVSYTNGTSTTFTVTNGINGQNGADGDPGQSFMIMGVISNTSLLPDPSITPRNHAYVYNDGDPTTPDRLYYITGTVGNEVWSYSSFAQVGSTVYVNGNSVATFNADTKLDKVTTSSTYDQVYAKAAGGTNGMLNVDTSSNGNVIVQRNSQGQIYVPTTPYDGSCATSKDYVDTEVGKKLDYKTSGATYGLTIPTTTSWTSNKTVATTSDLTTKLDSSKCTFQQTSPIADILDDGVHIVYLASEPSVYYAGYIYLIYDPNA